MLRSLLTAATGLQGHQVRLDVVGRNISNVNTVAYKRGRANFSSLLGGSVAALGGSAEMGNGLLSGRVQSLFMQGELELTGNPLDFAIEGEGFFSVSQGGLQYFTRSGACALDSQGRMIHLGSGGVMQGYLATGGGELRGGGSVKDIVLDLEQTLAASATSFITLGGNLNSDSEALGTVLMGGPFFREAAAADRLLSMSLADGGQDLGLEAGDLVSISAWVGDVYLEAQPLAIGEETSLADLANWIESALRSADSSFPAGGVSIVDGRILVAGGSQAITDLQLEAAGSELFAEAFDFLGENSAGTAAGSSQGRLLAAAGEETLIADLYSRDGESMDGSVSEYDLLGETLSLSSTLAGVEFNETLSVGPETTLADFMAALEAVTGTDTDPRQGAVLDAEGRIVLTGAAGLAHGIESLGVVDALGEINLGEVFHFTETQSARDPVPRVLSTMIVDSEGTVHQLTLTFQRGEDASGQALWNWTAGVGGEAEISSGGTGSLRFDEEGLSQLSFDDGRSSLELVSREGGPSLALEIRIGQSENSITEGSSGQDLAIIDHDGEESGTLEDIRVDEEGIITGLFSNGQERSLAQIALARFRDNDGLQLRGENLYSESSDSGRPLWRESSDGARANRISVGALELSNVDLAQEFTTMITTQKGFQANAKIVKIGDEMLDTVTRLKR